MVEICVSGRTALQSCAPPKPQMLLFPSSVHNLGSNAPQYARVIVAYALQSSSRPENGRGVVNILVSINGLEALCRWLCPPVSVELHPTLDVLCVAVPCVRNMSCYNIRSWSSIPKTRNQENRQKNETEQRKLQRATTHNLFVVVSFWRRK